MVFWLQTGPLCFPLDWEPPEVRVCEFSSGWEFLKAWDSEAPIKWKLPKGMVCPLHPDAFLGQDGVAPEVGPTSCGLHPRAFRPKTQLPSNLSAGWGASAAQLGLVDTRLSAAFTPTAVYKTLRCVGGEARSPLPIWVVYLALLVPYSGLASSAHGLGSILGRAWEWTGHSVPLSAH